MKTEPIRQSGHWSAADFFSEYIRRNSKAYVVVLSFVLLFESILIIRGIFVFDFARTRHQLYYMSYIFMFCASFVGLAFTAHNRTGRVSPLAMTLVLHFYCTAVIAWSLLVSYLDLAVGNSPIVYLSAIMSIGGLTVIQPVYYAVNVVVSLAVLVSFNRAGNITFFDTTTNGVYLNLVIFAIISLILAVHHYRISRREAELARYLQDLSFRDAHTGIFNRRMFDEAVKRLGTDTMIGVFDLDTFKNINDSYGHDFGDECLTEVAAQLGEAFGERAYRIGGDEFTVLCEGLDRQTIGAKIDAINKSLAKSFPGRNISISAGFCRVGGQDVKKAIEAADRALYTVKNGGKRGYCFTEL